MNDDLEEFGLGYGQPTMVFSQEEPSLLLGDPGTIKEILRRCRSKLSEFLSPDQMLALIHVARGDLSSVTLIDLLPGGQFAVTPQQAQSLSETIPTELGVALIEILQRAKERADK